MSSAQKTALSLLIAVIAFSAFTILAFSGLFDYVETNFYDPRVSQSVERRLSLGLEVSDRFHRHNRERFEAVLPESAFRNVFRVNQSVADINSRDRVVGLLREEFSAFSGFRFVDLSRERLWYSTYTDDILDRSAASRTYLPLGEIDSTIAPQDLALEEGVGFGIRFDPQLNQFIYRFLVHDEFEIARGTAIVYVNAQGLRTSLLRAGILSPGEEVRVVDESTVLLNAMDTHGPESSEVLRGITWQPEGERAPTPSVQLGNEAYLAFSSRGEYGVALWLAPEREFEMTELMRWTLLGASFISIFLVTFLLLNLRQDPTVVLSHRVKRFQINLLREFIENKDQLDWDRWRGEIERRRSEVDKEIKRGIGRLKKGDEQQVDELLDRSWNEIFQVIGSGRKPIGVESNVDFGRLEQMIERIVAGFQAGQAAQATDSVSGPPSGADSVRQSSPSSTGPPRSRQPSSPVPPAPQLDEAEELDELEAEELEDADEPEELEAEELDELEAEELDELEAEEPEELEAEDVGEAGIEAEDEAEELDELEAEELEDAEELDELETEEPEELEAEELEEAEEPEELELEDVGEAEGLDELEAEELEDAEEPEELEAEDVGEAEIEAEDEAEELDELEAEEPEELEAEELEDAEEPEELDELEAEELEDADIEAEELDVTEEPQDLEAVDLDDVVELPEAETGDSEAVSGVDAAAIGPTSSGLSQEHEFEEVVDLDLDEPDELVELPDSEEYGTGESEETGGHDEHDELDDSIELAEPVVERGELTEQASPLEVLDLKAELNHVQEDWELGHPPNLSEIVALDEAQDDADLDEVEEMEELELVGEPTGFPPFGISGSAVDEIEEVEELEEIEEAEEIGDSDRLDLSDEVEELDEPESDEELGELESVELSFGLIDYGPNLSRATKPSVSQSRPVQSIQASASDSASDSDSEALIDESLEGVSTQVPTDEGTEELKLLEAPTELQEAPELSLPSMDNFEITTLDRFREMVRKAGGHATVQVSEDDGVPSIDPVMYETDVETRPEIQELVDSLIESEGDAASSPAEDENTVAGIDSLFDVQDLGLDFGGVSLSSDEMPRRSARSSRPKDRGAIVIGPDGVLYDLHASSYRNSDSGMVKSLIAFTRIWRAQFGALLMPYEQGFRIRHSLGIMSEEIDKFEIPRVSEFAKQVMSNRYVALARAPLSEHRSDIGFAGEASFSTARTLFLPIRYQAMAGYAMLGLRHEAADLAQVIERAKLESVQVQMDSEG